MTNTETTAIDNRDRTIIAQRQALFLDRADEPRVGDVVKFADGVTRRISHVWPDGVQTSDDGRFYLGDGYMSFSGSLYRSVPLWTLLLSGEFQKASAWIFHHDHRMAHNGVDVEIDVPVWVCTENAPA